MPALGLKTLWVGLGIKTTQLVIFYHSFWCQKVILHPLHNTEQVAKVERVKECTSQSFEMPVALWICLIKEPKRGTEEKGKAALRENKLPRTTVFARLYQQTAELLG